MKQNNPWALAEAMKSDAIFVGAAAVLVLIGIVLALTIVRSPWQERAWRADINRINNLERLANLIDCYRVQQQMLPAKLADLIALRIDKPSQETICSRVTPIYDQKSLDQMCQGCSYRVLAPDSYEICAKFQADMSDVEFGSGRSLRERVPGTRDWRHKPGRACFKLEPRDGA